MIEQTINDAQTIAGGGTGTVLAGRYRVIRQLGHGGMGSVWLAEDIQLDNKPFAVKMLPSILVSNKRAYRQLKDEALVAMKLVHPNIVQIRAFEENNGNPFLVMDYIDGVTLDDYLADYDSRVERAERVEGVPDRDACPLGGLPEEEVIRVLRPIAAALDYAHGEGVVHRDVKPANVMIRKDGHPFILDFGIAREIQETLTRVTGKLSSGTLLYMSPEQLNGDPPKKEQDIYSFAAMAYECLKGEPPFVRGAIEDQIKNKLPEPLPNSPSKIEGVAEGRGSMTIAPSVMAGLAKKPEDRPKSCMAVLEGEVANHVERAERVEGDGVGHKERKDRKEVGRGAPAASQGGARFGVAMTVLAVALVLVGGYFGWMKYDESVKLREVGATRVVSESIVREEAARDAEPERIEAQERAAAESLRSAQEEAERIAKTSATEIRIEAKVLQGKVVRISDEDGFKTRKDSLGDVFIRAEALYDEKTKRWAESETLYKDYIERSKVLIALDEERQQAVAKKDEVQVSFKKAEEAGAKTYARESWDAAVKTWNAAAAEFKRMEFVAAAETFANALREFDECSDKASNNKRIAEEKRAAGKRQVEPYIGLPPGHSSVPFPGHVGNVLPNSLSTAEKAAGWKLLWDGCTFDGWVGVKSGCKMPPTRGWRIENGVLTVLPSVVVKNGTWVKLPPEQAMLGGGGDIVTVKEYKNFILDVDFRLTKASRSSINYFYQPNRHHGTCEKYQIIDDAHPGANKGRDGNRRIASLYDLIPAHAGNIVRPLGEWNTARIVSKGKHVEHWLNGVKVLEYERGSDVFRSLVNTSKYANMATDGERWGEQETGRILLHDDTDSTVSFRNIKILEL